MDTSSFFEPARPRCTAAFRWLDTADGKRLRAGRWEPMRFPKATVVILQGRGEFIEKYEELATDLTKREIRVLTLEWRGQGKSTRLTRNPQRYHVRSYDDYVADMKLFMNSMVRFATEGKLFFMAHSMGALVALHYLAKHPSKVDGMILTSPMMDFSVEPFTRRGSMALASFAAKAEFAEAYAFNQGDWNPQMFVFENNKMTADKARFDKIRQWLDVEPALRVGGVTFGWIDATFKALSDVGKMNLTALSDCDKLMLSSPDDKIIPFSAQRKLADRLSKCEVKSYTGAGHELWMETDSIRKEIWKNVDDFMKVRIPNYVGGGTDRIRPDARVLNPAAKPPAWRPGSSGTF